MNHKTLGKLILLPNVLEGSLPTEPFLPASIQAAALSLNGLIAESEKNARRYLRRFLSHEKMADMPIRMLNEHTTSKEIEALLEPILGGQVWGLISDAGLPCVADPGSDLVMRARRLGIPIEMIPGPCSLIIALQLSGFSGQRFCFHGYLPRERADFEETIKDLEIRAKGETQIWIETPYRSVKMFEALKLILQPPIHLCVAANLTTPAEKVASMPIQEWKNFSFEIGKEPAVFLIYSRTNFMEKDKS